MKLAQSLIDRRGGKRARLRGGRQREDLTGHQFGRLLVISYAFTENGATYWNCRCDCGSEKAASTSKLRSGSVRSCGCMGTGGPQREDLTGRQFGLLLVISYAFSGKNYEAYWNCRCQCGSEKPVPAVRLRSGASVSCGCIKRDRVRKLSDILVRFNASYLKPIHPAKRLSDADATHIFGLRSFGHFEDTDGGAQ